MKPIRFYHMWAYRLFRYLWTPILKERPNMTKAMADCMYNYFEEHK